MDETDVRLCQMLTMNSRASYRSLADALGITVQAVHRRVRGLVEAGVIRGFTTKISVSELKALPVTIFGLSESPSIEEAVQELGREGHMGSVHVSGRYLIVGALMTDWVLERLGKTVVG